MSKWTHIAGTIRIDQMPIRTAQLSKEDVEEIFDEGAPFGSEGGLQFLGQRTQVVEQSGFPLVWGSVTFVGDLRDFEDTKKVENWLKQIPEKLKKHQAMIRQAAISIDVEYGPCIGIVWNPRTDNFTVIDIPSP